MFVLHVIRHFKIPITLIYTKRSQRKCENNFFDMCNHLSNRTFTNHKQRKQDKNFTQLSTVLQYTRIYTKVLRIFKLKKFNFYDT